MNDLDKKKLVEHQENLVQAYYFLKRHKLLNEEERKTFTLIMISALTKAEKT